MLYYDLRELLEEPQEGTAPELKIQLDYTAAPFEEVEQRYLEFYDKWKVL